MNLSEPSATVKRKPECRDSPPPAKRMSKEEEEPEPPKELSPATHIKINSRGKEIIKIVVVFLKELREEVSSEVILTTKE